MLRTAVLGLLSALVSFALTSASGCGTDAVGVDDCRKIESARCEAGHVCGIIDDTVTCERFYRDHCLHGLAVEEAPGAPKVTACVKAIAAAGKCGPKTKLDDCTAIEATEQSELKSPCDVILHPEWVEQCSFLADTGAGGEGGSTGGGGQSGASN